MSTAAGSSQEAASNPQAWFCTTGLPSDVVVEAGDTTFHLHKFPLVSRSTKLRNLLMDRERSPSDAESAEIVEEGPYHVSFPGIPGGAKAFEAAAKFCYGVLLDLSPSTVVPIRCAADYLGMSEDLSHGNLCAHCDRYLHTSVFRSLRASVRALRSTEPTDVSAAAESLGITDRLVNTIAARVSSSDPSSLFGWPVSEAKRRSTSGRSQSTESTLLELTALCLPAYKRVVESMEELGASPDVLEASLLAYAKRAIPGLLRSGRKRPLPISRAPAEAEQLELLELIVAHLPQRRPQRSSVATTTRFLFGLLRVACILGASEGARELLERRIGMQLDQATLEDLLLPSYSYDVETLYDVGCVERLVAYFSAAQGGVVEEDERRNSGGDAMVRMGRLVDGFLSEVAPDANLDVERFCALAFAVPEQSRVYDDGLYRAVDIYLKAHPHLSEWERERVCGVLNYQKLTLEACTHAAQNERLPLRSIIQVLFFEQLQLRRAIASTLRIHGDPTRPRSQRLGEDDQVLQLDMDSMRTRVHELERECSTMKKAIAKIDRTTPTGRGEAAAARGSLTRRFGCKFATQVCDSHERNIVEATRRRAAEQSA